MQRHPCCTDSGLLIIVALGVQMIEAEIGLIRSVRSASRDLAALSTVESFG